MSISPCHISTSPASLPRRVAQTDGQRSMCKMTATCAFCRDISLIHPPNPLFTVARQLLSVGYHRHPIAENTVFLAVCFLTNPATY